MALVTATRYNTLRQSVTNVLETGSGDSGYGQTAGSSNINAGDLIHGGTNQQHLRRH